MAGGRGSWGLGHPTAATAPSASRGLETSGKADTGKREQHSESDRDKGQSRGREMAACDSEQMTLWECTPRRAAGVSRARTGPESICVREVAEVISKPRRSLSSG